MSSKSLVIPINESFRIELDHYSWSLCQWKRRADKPDGGVWEGILWFRTLQEAGEAAIRRDLLTGELYGVEAVVLALRASSQLVAESIIEAGMKSEWLDAKKTLPELTA